MNAARIACAVCLGCWLGATTAWSQPRYEAIILHSERIPSVRSFGLGIGAGEQVGHSGPGYTRALLWRGSPESVVDLSAPGWDGSYLVAASGGRQGGAVLRFATREEYAGIWSGTPESFINLHPRQGYEVSAVKAMAGNQQVGGARPNGVLFHIRHAMLWRGSAESAVDLHPEGSVYYHSIAYGTDGELQVGSATNGTGIRAVLWRGSADTMVDLTPEGFLDAEARAAAGGQQVGFANYFGSAHAILWRGSAEDFVDLNPGPADQFGSQAFGTNGFHQVGTVGSRSHPPWAAVWSGTPESYHDLHQYLPPAYQEHGSESYAYGIDAEGNIIGYAYGAPDFRPHAVLWRPVPEPGTVVCLGALLALLASRRRRAKVN